jgi:hypothetical protein
VSKSNFEFDIYNSFNHPLFHNQSVENHVKRENRMNRYPLFKCKSIVEVELFLDVEKFR